MIHPSENRAYKRVGGHVRNRYHGWGQDQDEPELKRRKRESSNTNRTSGTEGRLEPAPDDTTEAKRLNRAGHG